MKMYSNKSNKKLNMNYSNKQTEEINSNTFYYKSNGNCCNTCSTSKNNEYYYGTNHICKDIKPYNFDGLTGNIITKESQNYNTARQLYNTYFDYYPLVIVYCLNYSDVCNAVKWANKNNINIKIRCGGHNYEGFSSGDSSLLIDVSKLLKFKIDKINNLITIQSGFNLGQLYNTVAKEGYQFTGGTCPGVGISGIVSGGGIGLSARTYGLVCDNLVNVKLVNQKGKLIEANNNINSDLFYAIRGAGSGNFGVFVEFTFKVRPVKYITFVSIKWPSSSIYEVIDTLQKFSPSSDKRVNYELTVTADTASLVAYSYTDIDTTSCIIKPLLSIPNSTLKTLEYIPFIDAVNIVATSQLPPNDFKNTSTMSYELLSPDAIKTIICYLNNAPKNGIAHSVILYPFGGSIKNNASNNTSFAHRNALLMIQYIARWTSKKDSTSNIDWIREFRSTMLQYACDAYYNFPDVDIKDYKNAYWTTNVNKLELIKYKYNPTNIFSFPQSL